MPLKKKKKSLSDHKFDVDPKLEKALNEFPQFVKKQKANMRKNQRIIERMAKGIIAEFKRLNIKPM